MIKLTDTFNNRLISRHRSVAAAVTARDKHLRAVRKVNGRNSYLTYSITCDSGDDISADVDAEEYRRYMSR